MASSDAVKESPSCPVPTLLLGAPLCLCVAVVGHTGVTHLALPGSLVHRWPHLDSLGRTWNRSEALALNRCSLQWDLEVFPRRQNS
ncbi:hypothetical protein VULLAG_LOCUS4742 [Vulpes lagopus]